jgi:hemerythrin superfamily protein
MTAFYRPSMDIAEILMAEHSSIRVWSLRRDGAEEWFPGLNSFVVEMHAGDLEDDLLFPALRKAKANDEDFLFNLTRIANDHRLIATLGSNMLRWLTDGEMDLFRARLDTYFKVVTYHNSTEEVQVFPALRSLDSGIRCGLAADAVEKMRSRPDAYWRYSGISREFLEYSAGIPCP